MIPLLRPPDRAHGEDEKVWLERARAAAAVGPIGLHTHWTSPTHARPTGGDPAARVRVEVGWMRELDLEPAYFCGGCWYTDDAVRATVAELGLTDCTIREGLPAPGVLPTTHSLGRFARASLGRRLPDYVHAYCHDHDLADARRRLALLAAIRIVRLRTSAR